MLARILDRPKLWAVALNALPFLAFCLYALPFSKTTGVEAAVIRVFVVYVLFLTYPTKKLVFTESASRRRWFAVLYTPHVIFGIWLAWWGCTHSWYVSLLYLLCSVACYGFALAALGRPAGDDEPI